MISRERRQWLVERLRTIAQDPLLVPEVAAVFVSLADDVEARRDVPATIATADDD